MLAPFADKWLSTGCIHGGLPLQMTSATGKDNSYRQYQYTRMIAQQTAPVQRQLMCGKFVMQGLQCAVQERVPDCSFVVLRCSAGDTLLRTCLSAYKLRHGILKFSIQELPIHR